ncbi:hypothetical protein JVX90_05455 [Gordonia sp. PDNC005]|uniref:hypothetical protein n=1 Tax=unclassified Gordonia (in: high G+C Gram-positive bacteria) TaxID=2657482 RepID=UPI0019668BBA|nr:hypothetical protein [Gordonia sp. PDNC005]QRY63663.1 hypothetical protein JVX90_05455 [Gordonia sp. PDNC005]
MTRRNDLPPITRRLNADLDAAFRSESINPELKAALTELRLGVISAVGALEVDLITSRPRHVGRG